jgi:hypothetical protein
MSSLIFIMLISIFPFPMLEIVRAGERLTKLAQQAAR